MGQAIMQHLKSYVLHELGACLMEFADDDLALSILDNEHIRMINGGHLTRALYATSQLSSVASNKVFWLEHALNCLIWGKCLAWKMQRIAAPDLMRQMLFCHLFGS